MTDEKADVAADVERADLRALVRDALGGVGPTERDVFELQLRQGLSGGEVADVLGISRNHAHALLSGPATSWRPRSGRSSWRGPGGRTARSWTRCSGTGTAR